MGEGKIFTVWTMDGCGSCNAVSKDLKKYGKVYYDDLEELKKNPPRVRDNEDVRIMVIAQLEMQYGRAPVVEMNGLVLTETEVAKARKGEL